MWPRLAALGLPMAALAPFCTLALLAGCANLTPQQAQNLQLELALAKQIGTDTVQIWCATSGIVAVIAQDASAQARVTVALSKNAKAATDACPMIAKVTGITVEAPNVQAVSVPAS